MDIEEDLESEKTYELDFKTFDKVMQYGFADTVLRVQSATIKRPYNIKNVDKMSLNQLNTALDSNYLFRECRFDIHRHAI
jgi:hypothetical protein